MNIVHFINGKMAIVSKIIFVIAVCMIPGLLLFTMNPVAAETYYEWTAEKYAINQQIGGRKGNAQRGRKIVIARGKGNCLACHSMPIPEEAFHGDIGPPLNKIAARLTEGEIRLRVVDEQTINPYTIMPGYYKNPEQINQILDEYEGKTLLTAQEIEDVVAYLITLK